MRHEENQSMTEGKGKKSEKEKEMTLMAAAELARDV